MRALAASLSTHLARQDRVTAWASAIPDFLSLSDDQRQRVVAGVSLRARSAGITAADAVLSDMGLAGLAVEAGMDPGAGVQNTTDNDRLKVLIDGDSQRMVTRLYQDFVSEENFVLFIEFVKGLDRYILKFRELAKSRDVSTQVPNAEGQQQQQQRGRGGKRRAAGGGGGKIGPVDGGGEGEAAPVAAPNPEELAKPDAPSATIAGLTNFLGRAL